MPICFKCGKNLATDQSLQYHLQKRVKCNTLMCQGCKKQFPNKLLLDNHKHECTTITENESNLKYTIFDQITSNYIYIIELNNDYNIKYVSNNFEHNFNYDKKNIINKNINEIFNFENIKKNKLNNAKIEHNNYKFNLDIKYNEDGILLIETLI